MDKMYFYLNILFKFLSFVFFGIDYNFDNNNLSQKSYVRKIYFFLLRDNTSFYIKIRNIVSMFFVFFFLFCVFFQTILSMKDCVYPDTETTFSTNLFFFVPMFFSLCFFMFVWCFFFLYVNIYTDIMSHMTFFMFIVFNLFISFSYGFISTKHVVSTYTIFFNNLVFSFMMIFFLIFFFLVWCFFVFLYRVIILFYFLYSVAKVVIKFKKL